MKCRMEKMLNSVTLLTWDCSTPKALFHSPKEELLGSQCEVPRNGRGKINQIL